MLIVQLPAFFFLGALCYAYPQIAFCCFAIWLGLVLLNSLF